jgi:2-hydroxy-6-oxonona-2,4-dienedioate hydrolase
VDRVPHATHITHIVSGGGIAVPLRVASRGAGAPVVFLHGLFGLNDHWHSSVDHLEHLFRCEMVEIPLLDLPGDDCSVSGATALVIRLLDDVLRAPAMLVGNSFGGHVALRVALDRPDLVSSLVLAGASGIHESNGIHQFTTRPTRAWLRGRISELFHDPALVRDDEVERVHTALSQRAGARALLRLSRSVRRDHLGGCLGRLRAPALLVWGEQDRITPPEVAHRFAAEMAGTRIAWIENCGHAPMVEQPRRFAEEVAAFAASVARSGPETAPRLADAIGA